jgi:hypothetical protein
MRKHLTDVQLSLLHPLGTMSHRVSEGDLKPSSQPGVPERVHMTSKLNVDEMKLFTQYSKFLMRFLQFCVLVLLRRLQLIHITLIGKAIPLQAVTGSECSRRLRLPDFKTIGT